MAAIKIAQLTNQTTLSDSDTVIIETATSTNKMTVENFRNRLVIGKINYRDISQPVTDLNNAPEGYSVATSSATSRPPVATYYGVLTFTVRNPNYVVQIAFGDEIESGGLYIRHRIVGNWYAWSKIA